MSTSSTRTPYVEAGGPPFRHLDLLPSEKPVCPILRVLCEGWDRSQSACQHLVEGAALLIPDKTPGHSGENSKSKGRLTFVVSHPSAIKLRKDGAPSSFALNGWASRQFTIEEQR
jgi:hypothetical protein